MTRWINVLLLASTAAIPRAVEAQLPRSTAAERGVPGQLDSSRRFSLERQPVSHSGTVSHAGTMSHAGPVSPTGARSIQQSPSDSQRDTAAAAGRKISPPGDKSAGSTVSISYGKTLGWLAVVLAGFVVAMKFWRRNERERRAVPEGLVEILGQHVLDARHAIRLVRIGQRVLVLGSSPEGLRTLSEITEPDEVSLILGGRASVPEQPRSSFAALLQQYRSARSNNTSRENPVEESAPAAVKQRSVAGRTVAGQLVANQLARESELQASREPN